MNGFKEGCMIELHVIVSGNVQGVGFRYKTQQIAQQLQLKGTVQNLSNGNVEIFIQGTNEELDLFLKKLDEVFGKKHISHLDKKYAELKQNYKFFSII